MGISVRGILLTILLTLAVSAHAQTEPEYRLEVGAGAGLVTYLGDFNGNILKGAATDAGTYLPAEWQDYSFNHSLLDVGFRYEYNFWPYGTGQEYRGAKRLTPYIYIGIGMTFAKPDKTETGINMPLGGGVKYKAANRVNVALEWTIHFTTSDMLDGVKDPYGISSSGLFKNTDCYSHLRLSLTYDLWAKCRTCHNDKD